MNYLIKDFEKAVKEEKRNIKKGLKKIGYNLDGEIDYYF